MMHLLLGFLQIAIAAAIAFFAYRRKSLDFAAMLAAITLAVLLYLLGGTVFLSTMLVFFLTSSALSAAGKKRKEVVEREIHAHAGARTIKQVAANSAAALLFAGLYAITRQEMAVVGFFAAFAACNADTWASEWGSLSRREPISILTFKPVQRGLSGGVTLLGMTASLLGSLVIAAIYFLTRQSILPPQTLGVYTAFIVLSGFAGSLIDSVLGETLQAKYRSEHTGKLTEKPFSGDCKNPLVKGFAFVTNDLVNLLSSSLAALLGFFLSFGKIA